jgi:hypothetical protein
MRPRIVTTLLAAVLGTAGTAAAQTAAPSLAPAPAALKPAPVPAAPAPVAAAPVAAAPAAYPGPTCATCNGGAAAATAAAAGPKHKWLGYYGTGVQMPVGCSCTAAERTFHWGSCKSFFTPAGTCGAGGCGLFGKAPCPPVVYGPGIGAPGNNCVPFTFLNR